MKPSKHYKHVHKEIGECFQDLTKKDAQGPHQQSLMCLHICSATDCNPILCKCFSNIFRLRGLVNVLTIILVVFNLQVLSLNDMPFS